MEKYKGKESLRLKNMKARAKILISGRVQGVAYRWFAEDRARERGLKGYVRNLPDGRVEMVVEGEKGEIEGLEERLWEGPRLAKVEDVEISWEEYKGDFEDFEIRF